MNSIAFSFAYILTILMILVSGTDNHFLGKGPLNFIYRAHTDYLSMEITFENIPSSVSKVMVLHNNNYETGSSPLQMSIDKYTQKAKIWGSLIFDKIFVKVELRTETGLCAKKTVADGRNWNDWRSSFKNENGLFYMLLRDNTRIHYANDRTCFAPNKCNIVVDLKNKCDDDFMCYENASQYICTMKNAKTSYNLYQTYKDSTDGKKDSFIGSVMVIKAANLKLIMTLELFDVNTSVNIAGKQNITGSEKIPMLAANAIKDYNATTLKYSETTKVQFSCEKYVNQSKIINVGIINTRDNTIKTFDMSLQKKFESADNGTILCCLYYVHKTRWTASVTNEVTLTRYVVDKTLLIYQRNESTENVVNQPTEHADSGDQAMSPTEHNGYSWLLYVFVTVIGLSALVVTLCTISKPRWFKKSQPLEETVESDNQVHQNQVLYADLNFGNNASRPQGQTEESHYASIIGELHPL